jgi:hypothetical protein
MRKKGLLMALCLIFGMVNLGAAPPEPQNLRLLHSDEQSVVLEFTAADLHTEGVEHEGVTYHMVTIPGLAWTTEVGSPQVPLKGVLLGTPGGNARVEVLESDYQTLSGYNLHPSPALIIVEEDGMRYAEPEFSLNAALYATDAFYPGRLAEIGFSGYMRDLAVAQVQFYPVQYNPVSGELRLYRRILARITWDMPPSAAATESRGASPAYENLLRNTILNYDALERPPVVDKAPPLGATDIVAASITPTLKIGLTEDGLYELNPDDLTGAGFALTGVALSTIKISNRGAEIPIYAHDEDSNNAFDGNDYVLLYGTAITDVYTTKNVYWLAALGDPGQRMSTRDGTPLGSTVPISFPVTLHAEEDTAYWQTLPDGEGQDHWFWEDRLSPNTQDLPTFRDYSLTLDNISTEASTATVHVRLKGYTGLGHRTKIYLNGNEIDDQSWTGQIMYDHEVTVPHSYLQNGSNTVRVEAADSGNVLPHQVYVNWIEIDYWDTYVAESDELLFGAPEGGTFQFEVTNFSGNEVQVFDVTDRANVAIISNATVVSDGSSYKLQFEDTAQPDTRYLALTPGQRKRPASIVLDEPSDLASAANGADYIIITHEDYYASALTLATFREGQGLQTETVKITDVYDEFSYGLFNPRAIQDLMTYAYENWTPAPQYVLLVGDANMDYKDNLETGNINYVPTHLCETSGLGQTPSDNWFVCVSGDDILPDMFLGRISVRTSADADGVINKIINYEQSPPTSDWNQAALFVADDDEASFESLSEELIALLPGGFDPHRVYVSQYSAPDDPTADMIDYIDDGVVMANYVGHGNVDTWGAWAGGRIFRTSDIASLNNGGKLPFVTTANCLNGFFPHPYDAYAYSLAEEFLRVGNKGALAVWAPTGLGYPAGHRVLISELYNAIFGDEDHVTGSATTAAKISTYTQSAGWEDLVETFVLFGDPASQLGVPTGPSDVAISGPTTGVVQAGQTYTATVSPIMATRPITYVWQATNQSQETHPGGGLSDTVHFTWNVTGTQAITVTATNVISTVANARVVTVTDAPPGPETYPVYLPIVIKNQ